MLLELLKRPGQLFLAGTARRPIGEGTITFLEFADGTRIEVMGRGDHW